MRAAACWAPPVHCIPQRDPPAALPSFVGGLKQGWAFAWRSLLAGELLVLIPGKFARGTARLQPQFGGAAGIYALMIVIFVIGVCMGAFVFGAADRWVRRRYGLIDTAAGLATAPQPASARILAAFVTPVAVGEQQDLVGAGGDLWPVRHDEQVSRRSRSRAHISSSVSTSSALEGSSTTTSSASRRNACGGGALELPTREAHAAGRDGVGASASRRRRLRARRVQRSADRGVLGRAQHTL